VTNEYFERPDGLGPVSGYSHAVAGSGRLVVVSGQLPVDEDGKVVDESDALTQARQVFANIGRALAAAGAKPKDVIRLGFYLTDLADLPAVRKARDEFLGDGPLPASSLVQVAGLILPEVRIEIDAQAMTGVRRRATKG
jgi:enamine deaminase RidA (YjgF/YER057c/UK114 family)